MKQQLHISVFGLKLTTIDEIKTIIEDVLPEKYVARWTNLNDLNLEVLLINDVFFDLPNIIEIRKNSKLKTLRIATDPQVQGQLVQNTLYLPVQTDMMRDWFDQYVFMQARHPTHQTIPAPTQPPVQKTPEPESAQARVQQAKNVQIPKIEPLFKPENGKDYFRKTTQTLLPSGPVVEEVFQKPESALTRPIFQQLVHYKNFEYLAQQLWHSQHYRQCVMSTGQQKIALINKHTHQFWLANKLPSIDFQQLELQHADLNSVVRFCHKNQPYDLQQGLWNLVWQNLAEIVPSYDAYYRLKYWPQPLKQSDRKEIFKLAAYFQHGAHVQYVHQQTEIPLQFIYRFIFTSVVANCIQEIHEHEADQRFRFNAPTPSTTELNPSQSTLRGFFSKLRKKLGL